LVFYLDMGFDMSHQVLQEQIDELREKVNQVIDEGIADLKAQKLVDDSAHVRNEFIGKNVVGGSTVVTDDFRSYRGLHGYQHLTVKHSVGEYVKHQAHTNGIESFWALLKRGYYGIYHHMSAKHLHRYVNEFSFRHNTSKVDTMVFINMTAENMIGKRLTYKELTHA
jgi:transposase-like protein